MENENFRPQTFAGVVVKTAMKDTVTVRVDRFEKNAKYKKYFVRSKKYLVHDVGNTAKVGDKVTIIATKPISKLKCFKISKIDKSDQGEDDRGDTSKRGVTSGT